MAGLDFEGTEVSPKIDRIGDAGNTTLVDLLWLACIVHFSGSTHHFCCLSPGDREFHVGIFLPVAE